MLRLIELRQRRGEMNKGAIEANEQLYRNGTMFILEMITERLDKIIQLLEFRNSIAMYKKRSSKSNK